MPQQIKKNAEMNVPTKEEAMKENNQVPQKKENLTVCQECGHEGFLLEDGRCSSCGAIGGLSPEDTSSPYDPNRYEPHSRSRSAAKLQEAIAQAVANKWNFTGQF